MQAAKPLDKVIKPKMLPDKAPLGRALVEKGGTFLFFNQVSDFFH